MLSKGMAETMQEPLWVHVHVLDAWAAILNDEEKNRPDLKTCRRFFFNTSIVVSSLYTENPK